MSLLSVYVRGLAALTRTLPNGQKKGGPTNNALRALLTEHSPCILALQDVQTSSLGAFGFLRGVYPHLHVSLSRHRPRHSGVALLSLERPEWVETDFSRYDEEWIGSYRDAPWSYEGRFLAAKFASHLILVVHAPSESVACQAWSTVLCLYVMHLQQEFDVPFIVCGRLHDGAVFFQERGWVEAGGLWMTRTHPVSRLALPAFVSPPTLLTLE